MRSIRVLVADDQLLIRKLLARQLSQERDLLVVGEAANGLEVLALVAETRPDVVLMDLCMPEMSGSEAAEEIQARYPETRVILLTAMTGLGSLARAVGASAYLSKDATPQEVLAAVRAAPHHVARGERSDGGTESAVAQLAARHGLTERERLVLEKAVDTELTVYQISHALTVEHKQPFTDSSVKHALARVLNKLQVVPRTRAALIRRVMQSAQLSR